MNKCGNQAEEAFIYISCPKALLLSSTAYQLREIRRKIFAQTTGAESQDLPVEIYSSVRSVGYTFPSSLPSLLLLLRGESGDRGSWAPQL